MKPKRYSLIPIILLSLANLTLTLPGDALAAPTEEGVDFVQLGATHILFDSTDADNADSVVNVTATCPKRGFLVASATALALVPSPAATGAEGVGIGYSLTTDNVPPFSVDELKRYFAVNYSEDTGERGVIPINIQRVDKCKAGKSKTYRLVVYHLSGTPDLAESIVVGDGPFAPATGDTAVYGPRLVVQFFEKRI